MQKCGIFDEYVIAQTGENEWCGIITKPWGRSDLVKITRRTGTGITQQYSVYREEDTSETITVRNEYYVYSNIGYGQKLENPATQTAICAAVLLGVVIISIRGLFSWRTSK